MTDRRVPICCSFPSATHLNLLPRSTTFRDGTSTHPAVQAVIALGNPWSEVVEMSWLSESCRLSFTQELEDGSGNVVGRIYGAVYFPPTGNGPEMQVRILDDADEAVAWASYRGTCAAPYEVDSRYEMDLVESGSVGNVAEWSGSSANLNPGVNDGVCN